MYSDELLELVQSGFNRLETSLRRVNPDFAEKVLEWIGAVSGDLTPVEHLTYKNAFPFFLVPYWLEKSINGKVDKQFQEDIIFSSFNLYYYVIMLDNLMDQDQLEALELSPALHLFHTWFQLPYQDHFPGGHEFWRIFQDIWFKTAVVTTKDAFLKDISEKDFLTTSSQKAYFAGIPAGAVCLKYSRPDLVEPWTRFFCAFGQWNQMFNDLSSWERDLENDSPTFFLCEGRKRKKADETLYKWAMGEGFGWGLEYLLDFSEKMKKETLGPLQCDEAAGYMAVREENIKKRLAHYKKGQKAFHSIQHALGFA